MREDPELFSERVDLITPCPEDKGHTAWSLLWFMLLIIIGILFILRNLLGILNSYNEKFKLFSTLHSMLRTFTMLLSRATGFNLYGSINFDFSYPTRQLVNINL